MTSLFFHRTLSISLVTFCVLVRSSPTIASTNSTAKFDDAVSFLQRNVELQKPRTKVTHSSLRHGESIADGALALSLICVQLLLLVGPAAFPALRSGLMLKRGDIDDVYESEVLSKNAITTKERTPFIDNMRFFLEVQVVFAHHCRLLWPISSNGDALARGSAWPQLLNKMSMLWVIPAFAFLSGYLSKGELNNDRCEQLVVCTILPVLMYAGVSGESLSNLLTTGTCESVWFFGVLAAWRLVINFLRPFSRAAVVSFSVCLSAAAPYILNESDYFAYKMFMSCFFFFALGFAIEVNGSRLAAFVDSWYFRGACALMLLAFTCAFCDDSVASLRDHYLADVYDLKSEIASPFSLETDIWQQNEGIYGTAWAWVPRVLGMVCAIVLGTIACLVLPQDRMWYTKAGERNAYAYLLHAPLIVPLYQLFSSILPLGSLEQLATQNGLYWTINMFVWFLYLAIVPVLLTFSLSTRPVRLATWLVVEPTWVKLFLPGGVQRYLHPDTIHTLAPADLGLNSPMRFAIWASCESVLLAILLTITGLAPVNGPKYLVGFCALFVVSWQLWETCWCRRVEETASQPAPPISELSSSYLEHLRNRRGRISEIIPQATPAAKEHSIFYVVLVSAMVGFSFSSDYAIFHAPSALPSCWQHESALFYVYSIFNIVNIILGPSAIKRFGLITSITVMFSLVCLSFLLLTVALIAVKPNVTLMVLSRVALGVGGGAFCGQIVVMREFGGGPHEAVAMGTFFSIMSGLGSGVSFWLLKAMVKVLGEHFALYSLCVWGAASGLAWAVYCLCFMSGDASSRDENETSWVELKTTLNKVRNSPSLLMVFAYSYMVTGCVQYTAINFLPRCLVSLRRATVPEASTLPGVIYFLIASLPFGWGYLLDFNSGLERLSAYTKLTVFGTVLTLVGVVLLQQDLMTPMFCSVLIGIGLSPVETTVSLIITSVTKKIGLDEGFAFGCVWQMSVILGVLVGAIVLDWMPTLLFCLITMGLGVGLAMGLMLVDKPNIQ